MAIREHVCTHCNFYGTDSEILLVCPDCGCSEITNTEILKSGEEVEFEEADLSGEIEDDFSHEDLQELNDL